MPLCIASNKAEILVLDENLFLFPYLLYDLIYIMFVVLEGQPTLNSVWLT